MRCPGRVRRGRSIVIASETGQTTTEYVTIVGMILLATLGVLAILSPMATIVANLARRIVLDLSS